MNQKLAAYFFIFHEFTNYTIERKKMTLRLIKKLLKFLQDIGTNTSSESASYSY